MNCIVLVLKMQIKLWFTVEVGEGGGVEFEEIKRELEKGQLVWFIGGFQNFFLITRLAYHFGK